MPRQALPEGTLGKHYLRFTTGSRRRVNDDPDEPGAALTVSRASDTAIEAIDSVSHINDEPLGNLKGILHIPSELRLIIFREALRVTPKISSFARYDICSRKKRYPATVNLTLTPRNKDIPSVLAVVEVCRKFYEEATPIFYQVNHLRLSNPATLFHFVSIQSKYRRSLLRNIRIGAFSRHEACGWQLASRACSILSLCRNLREVDIELWVVAEDWLPYWMGVLEWRTDLLGDTSTLAVLHRSLSHLLVQDQLNIRISMLFDPGLGSIAMESPAFALLSDIWRRRVEKTRGTQVAADAENIAQHKRP